MLRTGASSRDAPQATWVWWQSDCLYLYQRDVYQSTAAFEGGELKK